MKRTASDPDAAPLKQMCSGKNVDKNRKKDKDKKDAKKDKAAKDIIEVEDADDDAGEEDAPKYGKQKTFFVQCKMKYREVKELCDSTIVFDHLAPPILPQRAHPGNLRL